MDKTRVEREANRVLSEYKADTIPVDVVGLAHKMGVEVHYDDLENEVSGMLVIDHDHKHIVVNSLHPSNRQRFTIAHELGHLALHAAAKDQPIFIDTKYYRYKGVGSNGNVEYVQPNSTTSVVEEREANLFAEALLMPSTLVKYYVDDRKINIRDEFDVAMLAIAFGVSEQAMSIRAKKLDLLDIGDD